MKSVRSPCHDVMFCHAGRVLRHEARDSCLFINIVKTDQLCAFVGA